MKALFTLSFLLFTFFYSHAQITFQKTYGGLNEDIGYSVQQVLDGGYIITGYTRSFGVDSADIYLVKTNSAGDTAWTKTYGGLDLDQGKSVQQTLDGGYVITGYTRSFGAGNLDFYLLKTDSVGDTIWTKTYGGLGWDVGRSVQQTLDSGYIIVGETTNFGVGSADIYLVKTNSGGDTIWTKTYGGVLYDRGYSVQQTTDGGYVIAGFTESYGAGSRDIYLIKTNSMGDTVWTKTYGDSLSDEGRSVRQTLDGGYIVVGRTSSFGAGSADIYLIKTNSMGDTIWTKTYGDSLSDEGNSVRQTLDGGYIIAGSTQSFGAGAVDVYLIKTDNLGDTLWTKTYGDVGGEGGSSVQQTTDGGYIVAGRTSSFGAGMADVYLIKTDSLGNVDTSVGISLDLALLLSGVSVFPNPFSSTANIVIANPAINGMKQSPGDIRIAVYDVLGREQEIASLPLAMTGNELRFEIKRGNLPAGLYFFKIMSSSTMIGMGKLVVE